MWTYEHTHTHTMKQARINSVMFEDVCVMWVSDL